MFTYYQSLIMYLDSDTIHTIAHLTLYINITGYSSGKPYRYVPPLIYDILGIPCLKEHLFNQVLKAPHTG